MSGAAQEQTFRHAFVGRGLVSLTTAYMESIKHPKHEFDIYGEKTGMRASDAAPAMFNVFGEITSDYFVNTHFQRLLTAGVESRDTFIKYFENKLDIGRGTFVYGTDEEIVPMVELLKKFGEDFVLEDYDGSDTPNAIHEMKQTKNGSSNKKRLKILDEIYVDVDQIYETIYAAFAKNSRVRLIEKRVSDAQLHELATQYDSVFMAPGDGIFGFPSLGHVIKNLTACHGWSFTKMRKTTPEKITCQRTPPEGPFNPCGPYLLYFRNRVCLGATSRIRGNYTGIGFIDNFLHRRLHRKARLNLLETYKGLAFNAKGEPLDFDSDRQGNRVVNLNTGLPTVGRRVIDEATQREVFVATALYREGVTLSGWVFNRYDEYVQMKLGGVSSSAKKKNLLPFDLEKEKQLADRYRYIQPYSDFTLMTWFYYTQFFFPRKSLNAGLSVMKLKIHFWKYIAFYLSPIVLDLLVYGVFRWYQPVLILFLMGYSFYLWFV